MSKDNIIELNAHAPTVESVISRLNRYKDEIKHIQVIVEWDDDGCGIYGDVVKASDLTYYLALYDIRVKQIIGDD